VKSCVIHVTDKKNKFPLPLKLSLLRGSRPKSAMASSQHLAYNVPNFTQIGSLSASDRPNFSYGFGAETASSQFQPGFGFG